jgi:hypothetical protein
MGRPRKPIPGWNDDEVDRWLRQYRGSARECVRHLLPGLDSVHKNRAVVRVNYRRDALIAEGLDFSTSRAPKRSSSRPTNLVSLPRPATPSPAVTEQAEDPSPPRGRTPSPRSISPPDPPSKIENVAAMNRPAMLAWTINEAAAKAREMPSDKSAAAYFKIIAELHTELDQLRKTGNGQEVTMEAILENIARMATGLPNKFIDEMLREHLRRNPKQHVTVKKAV